MSTSLKALASTAGAFALATGLAIGADAPVLDRARTARLGGEPQQAVEILRTAPADAAGVEMDAELALALLAAGQSDEAARIAEQALARKAADPSASRALALTLSARYDSARALDVIDAALAAHPGDGPLLAARGRVLWEIRRTRSAVEALQQASNDPHSAAEAHYWLGRIYHFKGWQGEGAFPGWHDEPQLRSQAQAMHQLAAAESPGWYAPLIGLGETLLADDRAGDALAAFDGALARGPNVTNARVGRWRALHVLKRLDEVKTEVAMAAKSPDVRHLDAARRGFVLLGQPEEAEAVAGQVLDRFPDSAAAMSVLAGRVTAARQAGQHAVVIEQANGFLARFPASPDRLAVYDALIAALVSTPQASPDAIVEAIDARVKARPDPGVFISGGAALADRRARLDAVIRLGEASIPAASTFISENLGSYKMEGKIQGALARSRATGTDLAGWAYFLKNDLVNATAKLEEADRLSRGADMANQYHLAELARARGELDPARERYLTSLSLQGPAPLREAGRKALADVYVKLGNDPAGFEPYLAAELERRTEDRRERLVQSMLDRQLPHIAITDLSGRPISLDSLRGRVLLLNFFSSWCGACRGELPHVKAAYEKYRNDDAVAFLLVSLDDDPKRLERYLAEMTFPFPVARATQKAAEEAFSIFDVPATFYVDRSGVVRYEARGGDAYGHAADRVQWFIDELKHQESPR